MFLRFLRLGPFAVAALFSALPLAAADTAGNWPEFRGTGDGHGPAGAVPLRWSETENIVWKTPIHDRGWSSPVVWGDQVWVTTARADGKELFAVGVGRRRGEVIHDVRVFAVDEPEPIASINSYASPTPAIEEGRVYVHFGTYGTACLDTETGRILWNRRDLNCDHHMGPGSSPILFEDLLIVHVDGCDVRYVVALDKKSGKTAWKTDRSLDYSAFHPYHRKAFSTPTVIATASGPELISPAAKALFAYDPRSGKELWKVRYPGWSMAARPIAGHGLVFAVTDYDRPELWAVRPGGRGDVTETHVAWKLTRGVPSMPSLLLAGDLLFMVADGGIASGVEARTGELVWRERIDGMYSASPVLAGGRLYFFSRDGAATVIEPGREFRRLAANELAGQMMASPAVSGRSFLLRTATHLYRVEESRQPPGGGGQKRPRGAQ